MLDATSAIADVSFNSFSRALISLQTLTGLTDRLVELGLADTMAQTDFTSSQLTSLKNFFCMSKEVFDEGIKSVREYMHISKSSGHASAESINEAVAILDTMRLSAGIFSEQLGAVLTKAAGHDVYTQGEQINAPFADILTHG